MRGILESMFDVDVLVARSVNGDEMKFSVHVKVKLLVVKLRGSAQEKGQENLS